MGIGATLASIALIWVAVSVFFPLARDAGCNGVQLRTQLNAPASKPAPRPPIGVGDFTGALRTALRGDQQIAVCQDFADPFVLEDHGTVYAYSTNSSGMHVPVLSSSGLFTTGSRHDALPVLPTWSPSKFGRVWAPAVLHLGNRFILYYSTAADKDRQCISRAVSNEPTGPFADDSTGPMICPAAGGAIDPSPFVDLDGRPNLLWKDERPAALRSQPLTPDGLSLTGQPATLLTADKEWEAGVIEAPSMTFADGHYFVFYSGNDWQSASYAIGYALCDSPAGPCREPLDGPWLSSTPNAHGPGGAEPFTDEAGQHWLVGHAWIGTTVGYPKGARDLFVLRLTFSNGQPIAS